MRFNLKTPYYVFSPGIKRYSLESNWLVQSVLSEAHKRDGVQNVIPYGCVKQVHSFRHDILLFWLLLHWCEIWQHKVKPGGTEIHISRWHSPHLEICIYKTGTFTSSQGWREVKTVNQVKDGPCQVSDCLFSLLSHLKQWGLARIFRILKCW